MKILFVQPSAGFLMRGTTYPVCRSIMTAAAYMRKLGHDVLVHDRCIDFRKAEKVLDSFRPELVMIYVPPTASHEDAMNFSALSKERGAVVVWGEVVAAALSEIIVGNKCADFVITGETEYKLRDLIGELSGGRNFSSIPGLTFLENGKAVTTENENNTDLTDIPAIDWEMIDVEKCFRSFPHCKKMLYMYTSRGCPYKCTYCYNTMFYNSVHRKRPLHYVLGEIKHLVENHGLDGVNFSDELLLLSDDEIEEMRKFRSSNNLKFYWGGETRADTYKDIETLQKMYDAGCRWFMLGLETGSDKTREQINKPMDKELIRDFVEKCTKVGITTFGSFIIGFPDETEEALKETVDFALSLNLDAFLFNCYVAIPKTPMCDKLIAENRIDVSDYFNHAGAAQQSQNLTKNYSPIPDKDLLVVKSYFDWLTFTRKKNESAEKNMFISKAFDTLKHFAEGNLKNSVSNIYNAGKTFLTIVTYSHLYPKIRKKYGLHNINKK